MYRRILHSLLVVSSLFLVGAAPTEKAPPRAARATPAVVYKTPTCGCCTKWEDHLRENGFQVDSRSLPNLDQVKAERKIPRELASCHTAIIGGYFIEGHVPADSIRKLLKERPKGVAGLTVPGMPIGSPGMEGPNPEAYQVLALRKDGRTSVFKEYPPKAE